MEILISAILLGLMGSFHCVGMCGPIALSLPIRGRNGAQRLAGGVLYHLGRSVTYGVIGGLFGLIGQGFQLLGFQRWISIAMGVLMILAVVVPPLFSRRFEAQLELFSTPVRRGIQKLFRDRSLGGLFLIGLLNGLLPCGLVYLAVAGALGTGTLTLGILFMVIFGLGTIPMMLAITIMGHLISTAVRQRVQRIVPYMVTLIGLLFILRGLTLGIPFLSPPAEKLTPQAHQMAPKRMVPATTVRRACCQPDSIKGSTPTVHP